MSVFNFDSYLPDVRAVYPNSSFTRLRGYFNAAVNIAFASAAAFSIVGAAAYALRLVFLR